ncbi:hypothetical protein [Vibrio fluvialis]|uniref:hypothetical protein n=1 Tax=Vibrio fluvialis TaxID=676 RepID=UPI0024E0195D|nr:hypothetical protein [Vibrio fluvialis]WIE05914.1 hypothetical protein QN061_18035 [Vibrio fluvialis]
MKYTNTDKNAVVTTDRNGKEWVIPHGHRFWSEWGIDKAESEGRISEPEANPITDGADGSGAAVA